MNFTGIWDCATLRPPARGCAGVSPASAAGDHLDYKEAPYSNRGQDRREMLRDVTALANSEGGYLVAGIREDYAGRAAELTPSLREKADRRRWVSTLPTRLACARWRPISGRDAAPWERAL